MVLRAGQHAGCAERTPPSHPRLCDSPVCPPSHLCGGHLKSGAC